MTEGGSLRRWPDEEGTDGGVADGALGAGDRMGAVSKAGVTTALQLRRRPRPAKDIVEQSVEDRGANRARQWPFLAAET